MATLTNIPKNNASLTAVGKASKNRMFYCWMFWFTESVMGTNATPVLKHTASLTSILKH